VERSPRKVQKLIFLEIDYVATANHHGGIVLVVGDNPSSFPNQA
jgi:hypothetical protein